MEVETCISHTTKSHRLWRFCLQSLFREYGAAFFTLVILSHLRQFWKGLTRYLKLRTKTHFIHSVIGSDRIQNPSPQSRLVSLGFCLKSLDPVCISGRSNHDCWYFENNLQLQTQDILDCCRQCSLRRVGSAALAAGSILYIMTSARDILFDVFLPASL